MSRSNQQTRRRTPDLLEENMENSTTTKVQFVQPIKAPILKSFSRLALCEFNVAYAKYAQSVKSHGIKGQSKLECMDPTLMSVLENQYLRKDASLITTEELEEFIKRRLEKEVHFTEEGIVKLFADMKMDLREMDPVQRVTDYNIAYLKKIAENGLKHQIETSPSFRKQVVELLLSGIRPAALRQLMRQKTKTSDARTDPTDFFDILEEWAPMKST